MITSSDVLGGAAARTQEGTGTLRNIALRAHAIVNSIMNTMST